MPSGSCREGKAGQVNGLGRTGLKNSSVLVKHPACLVPGAG